MNKKEKYIIEEIQLKMTPLGSRLFRNNVGVFKTDRGDFVRCGVGGKGGSDLIGWHPVKITIDHVGKTVAVFTAIEVKTQNVTTTKEQQAFVQAVNRSGGIAAVVKSVDEVIEIMGGV
jgi:hypothetical protein